MKYKSGMRINARNEENIYLSKLLVMKKKKKFQTAAIGLFIIAVILLIPNTEWNILPTGSGFIILVLAELIALISVFISAERTFQFEEDNWLKNTDDGYILDIQANEHGFGKSPEVHVFGIVEKSHNQIVVKSEHDKQGNVTINAITRFKGKLVIS